MKGRAVVRDSSHEVGSLVETMGIRIRANALEVKGLDRWYVTDGANAVGPIRLDLLTRGVETGKVPLDSFVRHEAWKVWRPLADFADVVEERSADSTRAPRPSPSLVEFASSEGVPSRSSEGGFADPTESPVVEPSVESPTGEFQRPTWVELRDDAPVATDDVPPAAVGHWGAARPAESSDGLPDDALAGAADLADAMLLLLGGLARRTQATGALLHRMFDDGPTVVCVHGEYAEALGEHASLMDPVVVAAASGYRIIAEPTPGPAGEAMARRLRRNGATPVGLVMFPIRPRERLLGFVEIGRARAFTFAELLKAEELVAAFEQLVTQRGWTF